MVTTGFGFSTVPVKTSMFLFILSTNDAEPDGDFLILRHSLLLRKFGNNTYFQ